MASPSLPPEVSAHPTPTASDGETPLSPPPPLHANSDTPNNGDAPPPPAPASAPGSASASADPVIDPELIALPPPPANGKSSDGEAAAAAYPGPTSIGIGMGITESIASAPNPRPTDFIPPQFQTEDGLDLEALENAADDDLPGSPTARLMRAIAPPNAAMSTPQWPPPPPNSSVNLFIGRALLSNGNDNWPLKPNDIVNWIRKHYPSEWDGDEGRCSAHRVRTYLARKGADMYYEKLNQGCIAGWRIRQNHLWRFENGGFQGRGMKQEEAIANAAKESEAIATAARKAAAAEALAAGHPGVKVSMSQPGVSDGLPASKRPRTKAAPRRKSTKRDDGDLSMISGLGDTSASYYDTSANSQTLYGHLDPAVQSGHAGPSTSTPTLDLSHPQQQPAETTQTSDTNHDHSHSLIDPDLHTSHDPTSTNVDPNIVQQAMQAAAGQMDELEMGMQLPIEMQMHSNEHDDAVDDRFGGIGGIGGIGYGGEQGQHPYTPHDGSYGYNT